MIDSVAVKLARSMEHIVSLRTESADFVRDHPVGYRMEHDDNQPKGWAFYAVSAQVPDRFGAIIGDVLTNMRAALDHLAWQVLSATRPTPPAREKIYFPIRSAAPAPGDRVAMLNHFPAAARPIVDRVQPYQNVAKKNPAELHPLYVLNLLVNTDKHRALTLTEMFGADSDIRVVGPGGSPLYARIGAPGGVMTDRIGWLPDEAFPSGEPWETIATINPIVAIDIGSREMYPVADLLYSMHRYVQEEVITPISTACS